MEEKKKIKSFTDLFAWREGHQLVLLIYRVTKDFPRSELFCLIDQMRRAVISITSNIAEGFSRLSPKEKYQFYCISYGSLTELQNQLLIAKDVGYLNKQDFDRIASKTILVGKLINGLKRVKEK